MRKFLCLFLAVSTAAAHAVLINIRIQNFAFDSDDVTINVGDQVKWTNLDSSPHTATSMSGPTSFDSGTLTQNQTFTYTFTTAGEYEYMCNIHHSMTGMITVVPEPSGLMFAGLGSLALILRRRRA